LDNGLTWTLGGTRTNIDKLAFDRFTGALLAVVGADLYRSIDSAKTWISAGAAQSYLTPDGYGNLLGVNLSNVMYRSTNGGQSWFESNSGLTSGTIQYLAADSAGRLFAGTSGGGLYRSTNSGNNWSSVNNGLLGSSVTSVVPGAGDALLCSISGTGVFRSTDHGDAWTAINDGLATLQVGGLFRGASGSLIAATSDGKMYRTTQPLTSVTLDEIPQTFALDQNVPNPFNPTTTVSFVVASPSTVSLTVVDMQGRVVATLANQEFAVGRYVRTFDAADISSGIYFCRLIAVPESNSRQAISLARKMVLLR
jgi:ligand-binding sensor domain-containing protein